MQSLSENNNRSVEKSTTDLSHLMEGLLTRARNQGATSAAVAITCNSGFSVDVRMREIENVTFNEDKGIRLIVYIGHRMGAASSTDTSPAALDALAMAACDIAKVSAIDTCFGLADADLMAKRYPNLNLFHAWDIKPAEAIEKALTCETYALNLDKRISNSDGVSISTYSSHRGYANTHGCLLITNSTHHSLSCSLIAQKGKVMQRDYDYSVSRDASRLLSLEQLAENAVERACSRLDARKLKTQKSPVLFSSRVSNSLFSHFIQAISGSNLYRKSSFLVDSLGKQIFPDEFKIYEQPHLAVALGSAPADGEGVPTRNNIFVAEGILCNYVLGSYAARRLGMKTTANSDGVHNLTVMPTASGLDNLLKTMDKGLFVTELMGRSVNGLTGDYSRGAKGFWVENGKVQYPVEEITIAGNLKDMFRNIRAIGDDINPNIATICGSVLIEEMTIAGH